MMRAQGRETPMLQGEDTSVAGGAAAAAAAAAATPGKQGVEELLEDGLYSSGAEMMQEEERGLDALVPDSFPPKMMGSESEGFKVDGQWYPPV